MRTIRTGTLLLFALLLVASGCASAGKQRDALERNQTAWASAIRWNDVEAAVPLIDPARRQAHPLDALSRERYAQVQVTGYRELRAQVGATEASREIEVRVVNRHTMAERTLRLHERWRWDPVAATWWNVEGLPDFWAGE
ncbi:hypothetical protein [Luteimonas deserti]|uniref:Lipoprotein n=1 Tax=Luteimonas deserti TaxID=2752306 RepID=A0A7Z0QQX7_9GAMM|nr:hypothetical protein [Luteimonas deserti]NYZ61375.1 hypothetical protein [Luteimonas deserti]